MKQKLANKLVKWMVKKIRGLGTHFSLQTLMQWILRFHSSHQFPRTNLVAPVTSFLPGLCDLQSDVFAHEGARLASLAHLPITCTASRIRLSRAGFYYDVSKIPRDQGNIDEVVCYSCGLTCANWNTKADPTTVHQELSPSCPHLQNVLSMNLVGGNSSVPAFETDLSIARPAASFETGLSIARPAASFDTGLSIACPAASFENSLQSSGYFGPTSTNSLSALGVTLVGNKNDDSRQNYPLSSLNNASLVAGPAVAPVIGVPSTDTVYSAAGVNESSPCIRESGWNQDALGQHSVTATECRNLTNKNNTLSLNVAKQSTMSLKNPVYPQYSTFEARLSTFHGWPLAEVFPPETVASYGFYYAGYGDCIRCFHCGIGLKKWELEDDVLAEHKRFRPSCQFLKKCLMKAAANRSTSEISRSYISMEGIPNISANAIQCILDMGFSRELLGRAATTFQYSDSEEVDISILVERILHIVSRRDFTST